MIRSMTGYGKQSLSIDGREYQIEIKSVNHRYLDINIKMPKTLSYLEDTIKKEISAKIKRGKIDVFITFENNSQEGKNITINKELAKLYIEQLKELAQEEKILTIGMYGENIDFYTLKGLMENILEQINVNRYDKRKRKQIISPRKMCELQSRK